MSDWTKSAYLVANYIINKEKKGGKGSIIAIIKGTRAEDVCKVLLQMPRRRRYQVREISLDMAPNMA